MLTTYRETIDDWHKRKSLPDDVIWIDLVNPTEEEKKSVEAVINVRIPSEDALSEIEASSRLILDDDLLYLSTPAVGIGEHHEVELTPLGFIIGPKVIVTVRFARLPIFDHVAKRLADDHSLKSGIDIFAALLEAIVDRGADVLENLGREVDQLSKSVFKSGLAQTRTPVRATKRLRVALANVGLLADRLAKARDVLLGVGRIAAFATDVCHHWMPDDAKARLSSVTRDINSLSDYETRISDKIQMLLDAVLGFITIEQNDLFKVLTIVSVVGVPPTLLAGIWGMNFKTMPELDWTLGYPLALLAIVASAVLPLLWLKLRGWLE